MNNPKLIKQFTNLAPMNENKLILVKCSGKDYELKTHDGRYFALKWDGRKYFAERFAAGNGYSMRGRFIKEIPNTIKRLVLELNKKPE